MDFRPRTQDPRPKTQALAGHIRRTADKTCQNSLNLYVVSTAESRHHNELNPKP
ncbi:hypothetical protein ISS30_01420 [bacterium]|nr:hypothetical protein [bacterium]